MAILNSKLNKYQKGLIKLIFTFFITLSSVSCGNKEYATIPLKDLDPKLKEQGSLIVKDILKSIEHEDGVMFLLKKEYITPMVHGRIMSRNKMYNDSYLMLKLTLGKVSSFKLFQVLDKRIIKTMRYKLSCENQLMKFVELKIDVNLENNLADFYLYVTSKDGKLKRVNVLPTFRK